MSMSGKIEVIETDGLPQNKKYSIIEDPDDYQKINVSTIQRIPHEYLHDDNQLGLVTIFCSAQNTESAKVIQEALKDQNYDVPDKNIFPMTTKPDVIDRIDKLAAEDHSGKSCLIFVMMGISEREGEFLLDNESNRRNGALTIKEVFSRFTGERCSSFRNKPKIFIFQTSEPVVIVQRDSVTFSPEPPKHAYQVPVEADILLVYKHLQEGEHRHTFIEGLCNNFHKLGQMDDIIGIVTTTNREEDKPALLISTLTKRFYITSSEERGYNYEFYKTMNATLGILEDISTKMDAPRTSEKAKPGITQTAANKWRQNVNITKSMSSAYGKKSSVDVVDSLRRSNVSSVASSTVSNTYTTKRKQLQTNKRPPWR